MWYSLCFPFSINYEEELATLGCEVVDMAGDCDVDRDEYGDRTGHQHAWLPLSWDSHNHWSGPEEGTDGPDRGAAWRPQGCFPAFII